MTDQAQVIEFLASPNAYSDAGAKVQQIDTHISCVFLTADSVYKLKKQLQYDFLDYSTLERRRWACEQEVMLNRRLAPDVYRGVVAVTLEADGSFDLAGAGEPVEWLVHMRRLPDDATLLQHVHAKTATPDQIHALAAKLAVFYREQKAAALAQATPAAAEAYVAHLEAHVRGNWHDLRRETAGDERATADRIHRAQLRWLRLQSRLFVDRFLAGQVVDGHGDLRPEHVYFLPEPVAIDCIEFSAEFRQIDVLDELTFLATECEALGADWIRRQLLDEHRAASGDAFDPTLVDFYASYRACVRAKVHCLRATQLPDSEAQELQTKAADYLHLAGRHAARLDRPVLIIVCGLSGTGKSTVADALGNSLKAEVLSTDRLRREMFAQLSHQERYLPAKREAVYEELLRRAAIQLRTAGSRHVIIDATFATEPSRRQALDLARDCEALALVVHCTCAPEVALARITERKQRGNSPSEATAEVYRQQIQTFAPLTHIDARVLELDTARNLDDNLAAIRELVFPQR